MLALSFISITYWSLSRVYRALLRRCAGLFWQRVGQIKIVQTKLIQKNYCKQTMGGQVCARARVFVYGVAMIIRLLKMIGLICKWALENRRYSAKETYNFKEPTNRRYPCTYIYTYKCVISIDANKTTSNKTDSNQINWNKTNSSMTRCWRVCARAHGYLCSVCIHISGYYQSIKIKLI